MTPTAPASRTAAWGLLALGVLVLYRLWVLWALQPPLDLEETYYLYWSADPALGYYSKPPMVAWLLAAASGLFGTGALAIKSVSLLLHSATALLLFLIGRRLWSAELGAVGAVTFFSLPIIGVLSLFTSTDAALHFSWALTLWAFLQARDTNRLGWWLLTGLAAGLGLMSKYTMGVMAIGLLGYLLSSAAHRRLLLRPGLWLGVVVAAAVWAPNLWWNAQHDFISFRHTAEIAQLDKAWLHPDELLSFLAWQWPIFGLLLAPLLVWHGRRLSVGDDGARLLLWVSLPMLAVICLQALSAEANPNWASAAYLGLGLLAGAGLWRLGRRRLLVAAIVVNLALLSVAYHYHDLARAFGFTVGGKSDPYRKRLGWEGLGEQLRPLWQARPDAVLLSQDRDLLAYLGYYAGEWPPRVARWNPDGKIISQYDVLGSDRQLFERPALFVSRQPLDDSVLARFDQVVVLGERIETVYPDLERRVHVYELRGFRGYGP